MSKPIDIYVVIDTRDGGVAIFDGFTIEEAAQTYIRDVIMNEEDYEIRKIRVWGVISEDSSLVEKTNTGISLGRI